MTVRLPPEFTTKEMRDAGKKASEFDEWPQDPRAST